jgi:hypothetical protein
MSTERDEMRDLEVFLSAARDAAPELGQDLRGRILADAVRAQRPARSVWLPGWLSGWALPGAAGGAFAAAAGFWIGVAAPLPLDGPVWMLDGLGILDTVTLPLTGVMDPLAMGF